jgi:hypothetical protein
MRVILNNQHSHHYSTVGRNTQLENFFAGGSTKLGSTDQSSHLFVQLLSYNAENFTEIGTESVLAGALL